MKRKIITTALALLFATAMLAENQRVAVFDPTGNAESFIREIVREEISAVVVNTHGYTVLERSLINQVLEESRFQASGLVDEAEISEIGRMLGANLVLVTTVTRMDNGNFHISARLIDVLTARVERQQTTLTNRGSGDLIPVAERLAVAIFGETTARTEAIQPTAENRLMSQMIVGSMLINDGRRIYQDGGRLTENEVRVLMAGTDALRLYNQGLQRNRNGDIWFWSGIGAVVASGVIGSINRMNAPHVSMMDGTVEGLVVGAGVGAPFIATGLILKRNGRRDIQNSVDIFNRNVQTTHIELNFGLTPNGVGMVVNF